MDVAELQSKSVKELREISEKLPKDATEYMSNLIGSVNEPKKKEKVVKKKEEVARERKRGRRKKRRLKWSPKKSLQN